MKKRLLTSLVALSMFASSLVFSNKASHVIAADEKPIPQEVDELVYNTSDAYVYGTTNLEVTTTAPSGANGKVLHLSGGGTKDNSGIGLVLDFTSFNIPTSEIEKITFVAYTEGVKEWRVANSSGDWIMRVGVTTGSWNTIVLSPTQNFQSGKSFADISTDSYLGKFEFCTNHIKEMYIDSVVVSVKDHNRDVILEEMPLVDPISGVTVMNSQSFGYYDSQKASQNSVPSGYTGAVLAMSQRDGNYLGATFNYEDQNILITRVESITFRVYIQSGDASAIRITTTAGSSWVANHSLTSSEVGCWFDFVIDDQGTNCDSGKTVRSLANSRGVLGAFNIGIRLNSGKNGPFYIDSITVKQKEVSYENEFPFVAPIEGVSAYGVGLPTYIAEDETDYLGVPEGSTTGVLKLAANAASMGITFDFSNQHIKTYNVGALKIRFYLVSTGSETAQYPELRITNCKGSGGKAWAMRYLLGTNHLDEWYEVTLDRNGTNFTDGTNFDYFENSNGEIGVFELAIRGTKATTWYIDTVEFVARAADTVAPVITYEGERVIEIPYGRALTFPATAFDAYQNGNVDVVPVFPDGSLDENGKLKVGQWNVKLTATDDAGNSSFISVAVTVIEPDTTAPIIRCSATRITVKEGTIPQLNIKVEDNYDVDLIVTETWSDGALDNYGRLVAGEHTYTITASDLSNNTSTHTIQFVVVR